MYEMPTITENKVLQFIEHLLTFKLQTKMKKRRLGMAYSKIKSIWP